MMRSSKPATKRDTVEVPTSSEKWKCSIIGTMMPDEEELANVL